MDDMDTILEGLSQEVYNLHLYCEKILKDAYGENTKIDFPIDICKVAKSLNLELVCDLLNFLDGSKIDLDIAQLRFNISSDGKVIEKQIMIDKKVNNNNNDLYSNLVRFAIAREIGKYILNRKEYDKEYVSESEVFMMNFESSPYVYPKLYSNLESFKYEMCAMFLLIPMENFLNDFSYYIDAISDNPILLEDYFKKLAIKAQISYSQLINGYKWLQICAYKYYKEKNIKEEYQKLYSL